MTILNLFKFISSAFCNFLLIDPIHVLFVAMCLIFFERIIKIYLIFFIFTFIVSVHNLWIYFVIPLLVS